MKFLEKSSQQYNTYSEIIGGEINYHPNRRTVLDNLQPFILKWDTQFLT